MLATIALVVALQLEAEPSAPEVTWHSLAVEGAAPLEVAVVEPADFDPEASTPVLIALPPGPQTRDMVTRGLELYFTTEARRRGWIVVSPAAPEGRFFHDGTSAEFDALAAWVEATYRVAGGRVHLAGVSNGGRSAFHQAGRAPERFASLSTLPGYPGSEADWLALDGLAELPVAIWAGAEDADWSEVATKTIERLTELGAPELQLGIVAGEGHVLDPKLAGELFDRLDRMQARQVARAAHAAAVEAVLDSLHDAADQADEERYFGLFTPGAIFIGTDATERWTVAEFRAYAAEPFQRESAWTYVPIERHVRLSRDGDVAWFDERLVNAKYGETRGSGVLVLVGEDWRIAHYVLSFVIPNDCAGEVVEVVKTAGD